jgi:U1 small nuclear ribonucleoprotein
MTHQLPPNLLRLFAPRPPLDAAEPLPLDRDPAAPPRRSRRVPPLQGVAAFLERAKQEAADKGEATEQDGDFTHAEQTKREMRREERRKKHEEARKRGEAECESCRESAGAA